MISGQQRDELMQAAIESRQQAYAKYSQYPVGAALLCADGQIAVGCNIENASYGLTICAERVAVFNAVAQGRRDFTALAVATEDGGPPCGACRQVLAEFCRDLPVILVSTKNPRQLAETSLSALLPHRFGPLD